MKGTTLMANKMDRAVEIVRANTDKKRKEVICMIMEQLTMTDAGASTYYYNATKRIKTEEALGVAPAAKPEVADVKTTDEAGIETVVEAEKPAKKEKAPKADMADARKGMVYNENSEAAKEIQNFLDSIDVNETVPLFLRKGK